MNKTKEQKQFEIKDKRSCILYLMRIIGTTDVLLSRLKKYNQQAKRIIEDLDQNGKNIVPESVYSEILDKTSNLRGYLLNIIGDAQKISISYFKYRKQAERLIKTGVSEISLSNLGDKLDFDLNEFNRMRNWYNHVPESLLTSELSLIGDEALADYPLNPIRVVYFDYVSMDYLKDLHERNEGFYITARKLHQAMKRDYSLLIGESVQIKRIQDERIKTTDHLEVAKISAKIQGLKTDE